MLRPGLECPLATADPLNGIGGPLFQNPPKAAGKAQAQLRLQWAPRSAQVAQESAVADRLEAVVRASERAGELVVAEVETERRRLSLSEGEQSAHLSRLAHDALHGGV